MNCTICGKEFNEGGKAYATAVGSIESFSIEDNDEDLGFFASDSEPWLTVLCEDCGMKVHDLIAKLSKQGRHEYVRPFNKARQVFEKEIYLHLR